MTNTKTAPAPATDRQRAFATKLVAERDITAMLGYAPGDDNAPEAVLALVEGIENPSYTRSAMSELIDELLAAPKAYRVAPAAAVVEVEAPRAVAAEAVAEGFYFFEGTCYKVVTSSAGKRYARARVGNGARFAYAAGVIYKLTDAHRLTVETANELSLQIGHCVMCGRILHVKESVEAGIGPVCRQRLI